MTGPGVVWALPGSGVTRLPSCLSRAPSPGSSGEAQGPGACAFYTGDEYFLVSVVPRSSMGRTYNSNC